MLNKQFMHNFFHFIQRKLGARVFAHRCSAYWFGLLSSVIELPDAAYYIGTYIGGHYFQADKTETWPSLVVKLFYLV